MIYKNKHYINFEKENESKFSGYRDENLEEKEKYINEKLSDLPIHRLIKQLKIKKLLWDFDCLSLYPSAMWDKKSTYPKIETGYAFTRDMNEGLVEKFNNQTFTQGSAILKIKCYNPKNLIVQHLPVKEKEKKNEINVMRNTYITQVLTSNDIQEIVKIGGRATDISEAVVYRKNVEINPFEKVFDKLFALRQKYKD